jgi:5-methylcytosine-specific restriction endonuclease McrA
MLGYSVEELKKHLESKFTIGMSWENMGEWHIDHKMPDSGFVYSSTADDGFKNSWSLENLQPLWAEDNLRKSNKKPEGI